MATLNRFTADTIVEGLSQYLSTTIKATIYTSGGGMHNPLLMQNIQEQLSGFNFKNTNSLHINPDAKEAVLFAVLANECICGGNIFKESTDPSLPGVSLGKISFPW
jgi:anhydro-N-acetylmuramic acid kinase